jgi:hypothetical protein
MSHHVSPVAKWFKYDATLRHYPNDFLTGCPLFWSLLDWSFPSVVPVFAPLAQFGPEIYIFAVNLYDVRDKEGF